MPILEVHMMEGRTVEMKENLIAALTDTVCTTLGVKPEAVRIILDEMKPENFGKAGKPFNKQ